MATYYVNYRAGSFGGRRFRGPYRSIKAALPFAAEMSRLHSLWTTIQNRAGTMCYAQVGHCPEKGWGEHVERYRGGWELEGYYVEPVRDLEKP